MFKAGFIWAYMVLYGFVVSCFHNESWTSLNTVVFSVPVTLEGSIKHLQTVSPCQGRTHILARSFLTRTSPGNVGRWFPQTNWGLQGWWNLLLVLDLLGQMQNTQNPCIQLRVERGFKWSKVMRPRNREQDRRRHHVFISFHILTTETRNLTTLRFNAVRPSSASPT